MNIIQYLKDKGNKIGKVLGDLAVLSQDPEFGRQTVSLEAEFENAKYQMLRHQPDNFVNDYFNALIQRKKEIGKINFFFEEESRLKMSAAIRVLKERGLLETKVQGESK